MAAAQAWLDEHRAELADSLGHHYAGARTNWPAVAAALATVRDLLAHLDGRELPAPMLALLIDGSTSLRPAAGGLDAALATTDRSMSTLTGVISLDALPFGGLAADEAPMDELDAWLRDWLQGLAPLWAAVDAVQGRRLAGAA